MFFNTTLMVGALGIVVVEDFEGYNALSLPSISNRMVRIEVRSANRGRSYI